MNTAGRGERETRPVAEAVAEAAADFAGSPREVGGSRNQVARTPLGLAPHAPSRLRISGVDPDTQGTLHPQRRYRPACI